MKKSQILSDEERKYLSEVIKPYRNFVTALCKRQAHDKEYIAIWAMTYYLIPDFDAGTMYKGMEIDRAYTPKELGL